MSASTKSASIPLIVKKFGIDKIDAELPDRLRNRADEYEKRLKQSGEGAEPTDLRLANSHIRPGIVERVRQLAGDLEHLRNHGTPGEQVLREAPFLENWMVHILFQEVIFSGEVSGHPELIGPSITTSAIWVIASDLSWVRTTSRYYRLGAFLRLGENDTMGPIYVQ